MQKCRVVLIEDHTILRQGLCALLEQADGGYKIVGQAGDGIHGIQCVTEHTPDLTLIDISMPKMSGLSAIAEIKKQCPTTKVVALTIHKDEEYILEAFRAGADGYCVKDADQSELLNAIQCVLSGKPFFSPHISEKVLDGFLDSQKKLKTKTSWDTLTQRERDVLKLISEGHRNKDIGDMLCISPKTVEKHRANMMTKLDVHNAASLTAYAINKGLAIK